ncbi:MAG: oligoendopeptidase F [Candidatus Electryonea clarkiae]|nr:oligoendopeptidase F [Candidatus Electryonea clarkiae]MDP8289304.1 oligoendopeptidase F [Candidatus Electryonea clarkiae]
MKRLIIFTIVVSIFTGAVGFVQAEKTDSAEKIYYENRGEIAEEYTWNLQDIFPSVEAFNGEFAQVETLLPKIEEHKGHLGESADRLADGIEAMFDLYERSSELSVYAGQNYHTDTNNSDARELYNRFNSLSARIDQALSFIDPEIAQIPTEMMNEYLKNKRVKEFDHYIDDILRNKEHIRSAEVEEVLASVGLLSRAPFEAYSSMVYTDVKWPKITDENGEEATVSPALYYSFVSKKDRRVRRDAALGLFGTYTDYANTFASTYGGHVQKDIFFARNRGYERSIDKKMFEVNVPYSVIETLVNTVHDNFGLIHRYAGLREEILGIDEFHVYDLYVPLVEEGEIKVTYDEGYKIALEFWKETYGKEYFEVGKQAFGERWVDVYASKGKRGGAYSWGSYNSHPYMLLNWGGTMEDVFTLVHEMGHSIHSYMANKNQAFHNSDYSLFVAEVAAVASEALFLDYMLERAKTDEEKLSLLNMYMGNITGTFLRQIFFHEFEENAHEMAEANEPLTKETLGDMYGNLWKDYYGPELVLDDEFKAGWARIPHFYRTFYVWVYASSFAAGEAIAQRFREGDKKAVDDYISMLKLGGSVYPMDALKTAGVDMNNPDVIKTVMVRYEETLNQMEKMLK